MKKSENGAIAIDALIGLTFFMITILSIMFMSLIVKIQADMQYAINQTAKEVSGYYYLLDKLGLASVTSGEVNDEVKENVAKVDDTLAGITSLFSDAKHTAEEFSDMENLDDLMDVGDDLKSMEDNAKTLAEKFKSTTKDDAISQFKSVLNLFGKTMINKSFSYFVAPVVCKAIVPKYLTSGDINDYCKSTGLSWNNHTDTTSEYIDFTGSQFLLDGRSIKIDVTYTLNTKSLTFGFVDYTMTFHQTAATAAWIRAEKNSSKKFISEIKVPD